MNEIKLKSGKQVGIKELSVDTIDTIKDMQEIVFNDGKPVTIRGTYKTRTAWIRAGLGKIDGKVYNGEGVPDNVIKSLSDDDKDELALLIQQGQEITEKKPLK